MCTNAMWAFNNYHLSYKEGRENKSLLAIKSFERWGINFEQITVVYLHSEYIATIKYLTFFEIENHVKSLWNIFRENT